MKIQSLDRLMLALVASAALAGVFAPGRVQAYDSHRAEPERQDQRDRKAEKKAEDAAPQEDSAQARQDRQEVRQPQVEQRVEQRQERQDVRQQQVQPQVERRVEIPRDRATSAREPQRPVEVIQQRQDNRTDAREKYTPQQRQVAVERQHDQARRYHEQEGRNDRQWQQDRSRLQSQHRDSQYRLQQGYYDRLRRLQHSHWNDRNRYYRDDWYFAPAIYRYYYGGRYYNINRYQSDLIRQAMNYGYEEGYQAGRADRLDRWAFDFRGNYIYNDANYGYYGYYVDQGTYNYYFQEGFRRGYEDGYYGRYRYGRYYNGSYLLLDSVLNVVFNLERLH